MATVHAVSSGGRLHARAQREGSTGSRTAELAAVRERRRAAEAAELDRLRVAADALDATEPAWCVWAGPASRVLWAVLLWDTGEPIILDHSDALQLRVAMRETEQRFRPPGAPPF